MAKVPVTITYDERRRPSQRFIASTPDFKWGSNPDGSDRHGSGLASASTLQRVKDGLVETLTLAGAILSADELEMPETASDVTYRRV